MTVTAARSVCPAQTRHGFRCHSWHACGITAGLENGGLLEHAQQMAAHSSARTTTLYDRRGDTVSTEEVEKSDCDEACRSDDSESLEWREASTNGTPRSPSYTNHHSSAGLRHGRAPRQEPRSADEVDTGVRKTSSGRLTRDHVNQYAAASGTQGVKTGPKPLRLLLQRWLDIPVKHCDL